MLNRTNKLWIFNSVLFISNILFFVLYLSLCLHNRLALDDFHFLANINLHGVLQGTFVEYQQWSSRWFSVLVNHTILSFVQKVPQSLGLFALFNLLFTAGSVAILIRVLLFHLHSKLSFAWHLNHFHQSWLFLQSVLFVTSLIFLSTLRIGETWFWLCSTTTYLWSSLFFILGLTGLFYPKKGGIAAVLTTLPFFYIGGSSGPLALLCLLLISLLLIVVIRGSRILLIPYRRMIRRLMTAFVFCAIAFYILYRAPGNRNREQFFSQISLLQSVFLNVKMVGIIYLKRLPSVLPFLFVGCIPFSVLGHHIAKRSDGKQLKKNLIRVSVSYVSVVFLYQLSITFKTQDVAAYRALFFVSLSSFIYVALVFFLLGCYGSWVSRFQCILLLFPVLVVSLVWAWQCVVQIPITARYAKAYDERMQTIEQQVKDSCDLILLPLPPSGLLLSAEIATNPYYFSNQHLKDGLGLKGQVTRE